ncbi:MAG: radical SAM protein [Deltaproteobacteria bacterium]|nr:MAG: radical SAM protein [Deltaproteobacteria bacterium]
MFKKNLDAAVITTYRCNARCKMCEIWKYPTRPEEEFKPEILWKLPEGIRRLNITGGEPLIRSDIEEIVSILNTKTNRLEISTNGYFTDKIVHIAEKFPNITIRISVEGLPKLNDNLRGLKNGFDHALRTLLKLKDMGIKDIGFGIVISDQNMYDLMDLYRLCSGLGVEFAQATLHNSFYFHKFDNTINKIDELTEIMKEFITTLLKSKRRELKLRIKDWFRAYINYGLLRYIQGRFRPIPCGAATNSFFVDPWGRVIACNGSPEPWIMGDLNTQTFEEIWNSKRAEEVREMVRNCTRNCWMVGTAVPAMRENIWRSFRWVFINKLRLLIGKDIVLE